VVFHRPSDGETHMEQPRLRRGDRVKSDVEKVGLVAIIASFWPIDRERWQEIYLKVIGCYRIDEENKLRS